MMLAKHLDEQHHRVDWKIVALLERIGAVVRSNQQFAATKAGLSPIQLAVLIFILTHDQQHARIGKLCKELEVSQPTMSDVVRALEEKGLVVIVPLPEDMRVKSIRLSDKGRRTAQKLLDWPEAIVAAVGDLNFEARSNLMQNLMQLAHVMLSRDLISVDRMCLSCRHLQTTKAAGATHYRCRLLDVPLPPDELRVDCPEHERR